jgi:hypothetical protein
MILTRHGRNLIRLVMKDKSEHNYPAGSITYKINVAYVTFIKNDMCLGDCINIMLYFEMDSDKLSTSSCVALGQNLSSTILSNTRKSRTEIPLLIEKYANSSYEHIIQEITSFSQKSSQSSYVYHLTQAQYYISPYLTNLERDIITEKIGARLKTEGFVISFKFPSELHINWE